MSSNYGKYYGASKPVPVGQHTIRPKPDRAVPIRKVACPKCGAQPGEPCLSATGKEVAHRDRRRAAIREGL